MPIVIRQTLLAGVVVILAASAACHDVAPDEGTVEVIGLRGWTDGMLRDSLRAYRPDVALGDAACGEVLRDSLNFAEAAVLRFRDGRVVVTVIEPADSHRVVLRAVTDGPSAPSGPWAALRQLSDSADGLVDYAVNTWLRHAAGEAVPVDSGDTDIVHAVWALLEQPTVPGDLDAAITALDRDPEAAARRAAAGWLIRHTNDDAAKYALVRALRDPDWSVRGTANAVLRVLRDREPGPVDWRPVATDLRHLLDGTTLVFHTEVVKLLLATSVTPALAADVLSPAGAHLLLAQAEARHEYVRDPARQLLARFSEQDQFADQVAWARGIAGEPTPR